MKRSTDRKQFYPRDFPSNYDELITYYPRYYRNVREMVAILKANGRLLDGAQDAIEGIYTSGFIDSMDEAAIVELERFLHIRTRSQRTLEERRRLIKSYIIGFGKVSATLLSEMLQAYTGSPSVIKLEPFDDQRNNKLYISTSPQNEFSFFVSDVLDILSKKVPAHIPFSIAFTYQPEAPPAYIAVAQYSTAISCTIRLPGVIQPRAVGATAYTAGAAASARMMAEVKLPGIITPKSVSAQAYAAGRLAHTHETVTITIGGQTT